jgi:hypothetical protein
MASSVVLTPHPEVFTLWGEGGGIRTRVRWASGAATLPMSYSRPKSADQHKQIGILQGACIIKYEIRFLIKQIENFEKSQESNGHSEKKN